MVIGYFNKTDEYCDKRHNLGTENLDYIWITGIEIEGITMVYTSETVLNSITDLRMLLN